MISIIPTTGLNLSSIEAAFDRAGFDCFPRGETDYCFRRFFRLSDLQPLLKWRLKRDGVLDRDEVTLTYSETDNVVSAFILRPGILIEYDADSAQGKNLMWGFGLVLDESLSSDPMDQEVS